MDFTPLIPGWKLETQDFEVSLHPDVEVLDKKIREQVQAIMRHINASEEMLIFKSLGRTELEKLIQKIKAELDSRMGIE